MSDFEGGSSGTVPAPVFADRVMVGDFDKDGDAGIQLDVKLRTNVREYLL